MYILWCDILGKIFMLKLIFCILHRNTFLAYVSLFLSVSVSVFSSLSLSFLKIDNIPPSNVRTAGHPALL
jgi:hypothetical protein